MMTHTDELIDVTNNDTLILVVIPPEFLTMGDELDD